MGLGVEMELGKEALGLAWKMLLTMSKDTM
jgi:hypothetical protein